MTAPDVADARTALAVHGPSFHHAARLLGEVQADRAARLYAWCRLVDDLADTAHDAVATATARDRLDRLRAALVTGDEGDPVARTVLRLCAEVGADPAPAVALVDGVRGDLDGVAVVDERELLRYAHAVAGTVGLLMLPVLEVHDPAARPFAIDLGIGMQLTNIARDVVEDARRGRRYLPATWVGEATTATITRPDGATAALVRHGVARTLELAETYYASGEEGLVFLPPRPRAAIRVAARVYRRIGRRLARRDHDVWAGRATVGALQRTAVTTGSLARELRPTAAAPDHDATLHVHLTGCTGVTT